MRLDVLVPTYNRAELLEKALRFCADNQYLKVTPATPPAIWSTNSVRGLANVSSTLSCNSKASRTL